VSSSCLRSVRASRPPEYVPVLFLQEPARSATPNCAKGQAGSGMVQRVSTVAFEGIEARAVDVQVQVAPGLPAFAKAGRQCQFPVELPEKNGSPLGHWILFQPPLPRPLRTSSA
jgi:magnesium chelatase family protein